MDKMKSMTIHNIDARLAELIKAKAESEGVSVNKAIKNLLESALGITPRPQNKYLNDFKEFSGLWSQSDLAEFEEETSDTGLIDSEEW